jgi:hypothetical protein
MSEEQELTPDEKKRIVDAWTEYQIWRAPADGFYTFCSGEPVKYKKGDRIKEEEGE